MIGHYKTYTEDAPLMGKHVGVYWWSGDGAAKKRIRRGYRGVRVSDDQLTFDDELQQQQ